MNRFGIYLVAETSITAAFAAFVLLLEYQRDLALAYIQECKAPEKVKLHFVISGLFGRRRIMKQLLRVKYLLV